MAYWYIITRQQALRLHMHAVVIVTWMSRGGVSSRLATVAGSENL